jgi:hypothetical protein
MHAEESRKQSSISYSFPRTHLPYPEKNSVDTKQTDNQINDNTPFANPKWVLLIERKKNIG